MKTIFKSLLYFSFAGLILTGCAKNDDFSVPNVKCEDKDIAANKALGEIYGLTDQTMKKYEEDHVISGTVVSSDRGGNFYREIYFVSDDNKFAGLFKADIKGSYAKYELGSQIFIKLKDVHVQQNNGVLAIGAPDNDPKKTFISYLADPTYKKFIVKGCNRISPEEVTKKFATELTLKEAASDAYIGKLVTLTDVQFTADVRGKVFWSKDRPAPGNATLNKIEGKNGNPTADVVFRVVEQSNDFAGKIIPNKSGKMTGVMTKFGVGANLVYQFVPRFWEDLQLDQDTFEGSTPSEPEKPEEPAEDIKVEPGKHLAFPGANFEDWKAFTSSLNQYGLTFATEAKGKGWKNSTALELKGTPDATAYTFTVADVKIPTNGTKISFLMKGKADKRSISINLYNAAGDYVAYNLESISTSKTIQRTKTNKEEQFINKYDGDIDTKGEWIKVVLNVDGFDYNTSGKGSIIAFKHGGKTKTITPNYDVVIDEIRFEDGTPVTGGETPTDPEKPGEGGENPGQTSNVIADFNDWTTFLASLDDFGLKEGYTSQAKGEGRNGKDALRIKGEPQGNDFVFKVLNKTAIKAGKTKLVVWVKGTSEKSLSFSIFTGEKSYEAFNASEVSADKLIVKAPNNQYIGNIDTKGKWVKLTLDLNTLKEKYNTEVDLGLFALKVGGKDKNNNIFKYDLLIDSIYFE